jgi:pimeloyl-ACP methyl ester carboxylesterase
MHTDELRFNDRRIEYGFAQPRTAAGADIVMLHGRSSPLDAPRTVNYLHEEARVWLPTILDRLTIRRPVLFGHSDGASIALHYGATPKSDLAGIIALAPHVKVEDLTVRNIEAVKTSYGTTDLRARVSRHHADADSVFWAWNRIWLDPAFRDWNIEALLPAISCPILAIQGADDVYGTMEQIESIARAVPIARLLPLAACGHSPHRDQPQLVLAASMEFVTRIEVARTSPLPEVR